MTTIDQRIEQLEDDFVTRTDERVESDAQCEVHEFVWSKVGVRFWTFDMFLPKVNA